MDPRIIRLNEEVLSKIPIEILKDESVFVLDASVSEYIRIYEEMRLFDLSYGLRLFCYKHYLLLNNYLTYGYEYVYFIDKNEETLMNRLLDLYSIYRILND